MAVTKRPIIKVSNSEREGGGGDAPSTHTLSQNLPMYRFPYITEPMKIKLRIGGKNKECMTCTCFKWIC